ncbi:MAG TPA: chemoreceptor glutamine deamidase CheD [Rudaea sp.]
MTALARTAAPSRYHDARFDTDAVKLLPAGLFITREEVAIVTILGSCVSACLRDPVAGIGGMNHFMLPENRDGEGVSARYGSHAMELLINALLKAGARRDRLVAKVFGGGNVLKSFTANPVGTRNAEFVLQYLRVEKIPVRAQDLAGIHPRKIWFFPVTGRVVVQRLPHGHDAEVAREEIAYRERISVAPRGGEVELFN